MTEDQRALIAALTSFTPPRGLPAAADWDDFVQRLAQHGLAGLAAYNLEFRMPDARVPQAAREVLMGYQQGAANDVVFKLVTLKQALTSIPTAPVVVLDAAAWVETLYPHVSFRHVPEVRLLVREEDLPELARGLSEHEFLPVEPEYEDPDGPRFTLYNKRFHLLLFTQYFPKAGGEAAVFARAVRARALGPTVLRPSAEDAVLLHVASLARNGFRVPLIAWVDLRELVKGQGGPSSRGGPGSPLDATQLKDRAEALGLSRALWASLELLVWFQPDVAAEAARFRPELGTLVKAGLEAVIKGSRDPFAERESRALGPIRQLVLGA